MRCKVQYESTSNNYIIKYSSTPEVLKHLLSGHIIHCIDTGGLYTVSLLTFSDVVRHYKVAAIITLAKKLALLHMCIIPWYPSD